MSYAKAELPRAAAASPCAALSLLRAGLQAGVLDGFLDVEGLGEINRELALGGQCAKDQFRRGARRKRAQAVGAGEEVYYRGVLNGDLLDRAIDLDTQFVRWIRGGIGLV